jgi:hypothetical protein
MNDRRNLRRYRSYSGYSMWPTLRTGDLLEVAPIQSLRVGDVVLFRPPGEDRKIIHRVTSMGPRGIKTKGDHNRTCDPWVLCPTDILGRIDFAWRAGTQVSLRPGSLGRIRRLAIRALHILGSDIRWALSPLYRSLARSEAPGIWAPLQRRLRMVSFTKPGGKELHILLGRRLIARLGPNGARWHISAPFRLFLSEDRLHRLTARSLRTG